MLEYVRRLLRRRPAVPTAAHLDLGQRGERLALGYLKEREGYRIVATNFRVPLGRGLGGHRITGEIDLIAYDGQTLAFVEVKTRTSDEIASPERAVGLRKQRQIARAARRYRQLMNVGREPYRYDIVSIVPNRDDVRIELLKGYFDDRVFHQGRYFRDAG